MMDDFSFIDVYLPKTLDFIVKELRCGYKREFIIIKRIANKPKL
jgi:hypothetical protein